MKQLRKYTRYPQGVASHKDLSDYIVSKTKGLKFVFHNTVDNRVGYVDTNVDTTPPIDYSKVAMFFENVGTDDAVISVSKSNDYAYTTSLEISTDNTNWETWGETSTTALSETIGAGKRLYIRNANDVGYINKLSNYDSYNYFSSTGANIIIGGNIMSLAYKNFENEYTIKQTSAYSYLFYNMTTLVDASRLILPATTLADRCYVAMFDGCTSLRTAPELPVTTLKLGCYRSMFNGCTSLTTAPELPATTLANGCYQSMFKDCKSLTTAPELPATTLANGCYAGMFSGCTSLTTAPELPVTTLAYDCYCEMFANCTSLTKAPELPATTLAERCYDSMFRGCTSLTKAPELPATTLAERCCYYMFRGCTSLTKAPELPATTLADYCYYEMFNGCASLETAPSILPATTLAYNCYYSMFYGCTSLTKAPELPATTLAGSCYRYMFYGCSNLNYIKAMFTTTPSVSYTQDWLYKVSPTGTFVKNANATWNVSGANGIPTGWTVETATE